MTRRRDLLKFSVAGTLALMAACARRGSRAGPVPKELRLWIAPNEADEAFWTVAVERWNRAGRGLPVTFTTIPTTGKSEDTILTALVSGTEPDISSNIFSAFALTLADLNQVVNLRATPGFDALVRRRHMESIIDNWQVASAVYAVPIYCNPALVWWRTDLLRAYGIRSVPKTYTDLYALAERCAQGKTQYAFEVLAGRTWPDRWFDFIAYYYAASGGEPYLVADRAVYDNAAGLAVVTFINSMFQNGWTVADFGADDPLGTGLCVGGVRGPWDLMNFQQIFPDTLRHMAVGPMIGPAPQAPMASTLADSKGVVIFKSSRLKREAFDFLRWALGDEEMNLLWLEKTGMPPARGDLSTNPLFASYFRSHPMVSAYARYVSVAKLPAATEHTIDVQQIMTNDITEPLAAGLTSPSAALRAAVHDTNAYLRDHP